MLAVLDVLEQVKADTSVQINFHIDSPAIPEIRKNLLWYLWMTGRMWVSMLIRD